MTTQVTVKNLSPVTYNQIPVITTELLARLYGTEAIRIQQNHHENKSRFIEGKHFFKAVGDELKNLRLVLNESQNEVKISPKTRTLILWTETRSSPSCKNARNRSGVGSIRKTRRQLLQPVRERAGYGKNEYRFSPGDP